MVLRQETLINVRLIIYLHGVRRYTRTGRFDEILA